MHRYQADWVVPISGPPVRRGVVDVDRGRVTAVGPGGTPPPGAALHELGQQVILPSLVNAHTHLELSSLQGAVPPASTMPEWVDELFRQRAAAEELDPSAIGSAVEAVRRSGTGLVGDIGNTLAAVPALAASRLSARVFREVVAFPDDDADAAVAAALAEISVAEPTPRVRIGLAAHAPYSVGRAAFRALDRAMRVTGGPRAIHLAESPEELEFLRSGQGAWRALLERIGRWDDGWPVPGCGPVEYLDRQGWLQSGLVVVHGVQLTDPELDRLRAVGATLVTCPRSNRWTGVGDPPVTRFVRSGVALALGTDSLASAPDLNLFSELACLRELAPEVPARTLLDCATRQGARALGFGDELGDIQPGRLASLIAVQVPDGVDDVEEYLVRGVSPEQVTWLDHHDGPARHRPPGG